MVRKNGFFDETTRTKSPTTPAERMAAELANWIKRKRLNTAPIRLVRWVLDIEKLFDLHDHEQVAPVLEWYVSPNRPTEFVPEVRSADGFRRRFADIREAMLRAVPADELPAEAQSILAKARQWNWPGEFVEQLQTVVARTWSNYVRLYGQVEAARRSSRLTGRTRRLLDHLDMMAFFRQPAEFVLDWMDAAQHRVAEWNGFSGHAKPVIFRPDNVWFDREGLRIAEEWSDSTVWRALMSLVLAQEPIKRP